MSVQNKNCKHQKIEEQYLCLEDSCLIKQELKLDCFRCLTQSHAHPELIIHIVDLVAEAQKSQQRISDLIDSELQFCECQKQKIEQEVEKKRQLINGWLDQQQKHLIQEVEEYEKELKNQKQQTPTIQLTQDNLQELVDFKKLNITRYEEQSDVIKKALEQETNFFNQYFQNQFERFCINYPPLQISLEEFQNMKKKIVQLKKTISYEQCLNQGCSSHEKNMICLEQSCQLKTNTAFECPTCLTSRHWTEKTFETHSIHFMQADKLWQLQDKKINDAQKYSDAKKNEIKKQSLDLVQLIAECQQQNEKKLYQFQQFMILKEKEILKELSKLDSFSSKEKYVVHNEILQMDFSIISNIEKLENNFKSIQQSIKQQIEKEEKYSQSQFQDLWLKEECLLSQDSLLRLSKLFPVCQKNLELQNQIKTLENNLEENNKKNNEQLQEMSNDLKKLKTEMKYSFFKTLKEQNLCMNNKFEEQINQIGKMGITISNLKDDQQNLVNLRFSSIKREFTQGIKDQKTQLESILKTIASKEKLFDT